MRYGGVEVGSSRVYCCNHDDQGSGLGLQILQIQSSLVDWSKKYPEVHVLESTPRYNAKVPRGMKSTPRYNVPSIVVSLKGDV